MDILIKQICEPRYTSALDFKEGIALVSIRLKRWELIKWNVLFKADVWNFGKALKDQHLQL